MASNFDGLQVSGSVQGIFKCTWTIQRFSSIDSQVGKPHKSKMFQLEEGGMSWCLVMFPGGINADSEGCVSCFVCIINKTRDLKVKSSISLRNTDGVLIYSGAYVEYTNLASSNRVHGYIKTIKVNDEKFKLVNDTLVVTAEVNYCTTCVKDGVNIYRSAELTPQENLIEDWRNLWTSKKNTDCFISAKRGNIPAHSLVLSARSKVFAAMFEHDTLEKSSRRVQVIDFEIHTMVSFMEFLYTGNVRKMDFVLALELLRASDKYEVSHLKLYCTNYLMSILNSANVCSILASADTYNAEKLHSHAMEYIYENLSEDDLEDQRPIFKNQPDLLWSLLKRFVKKRRISTAN